LIKMMEPAATFTKKFKTPLVFKNHQEKLTAKTAG